LFNHQCDSDQGFFYSIRAMLNPHFPHQKLTDAHREDPHFDYGREQVYPGKNQRYHIRPFKAAIAAGTRQMMP